MNEDHYKKLAEWLKERFGFEVDYVVPRWPDGKNVQVIYILRDRDVRVWLEWSLGANLRKYIRVLKDGGWFTVADIVEWITTNGVQLEPFSSYKARFRKITVVLNTVDEEGADITFTDNTDWLGIVAPLKVSVLALVRILQDIERWREML